MKTLVILWAGLCLVLSLRAQSIQGKVLDEKGQPLAGANLTLKQVKDTAAVQSRPSDLNGSYHFDQIKPGSYTLTVTAIGFKPDLIIVSLADTLMIVPDLKMQSAATALREVVVTAKIPAIEVRSDRTILNVAASVNSSGKDALELLRTAPGVTVDQNNAVMLNGKNGTQVYINSKSGPLSGDDLAAYLHSLPSAQIEAIEIIANPSARFEAAGSGGIINIRLKKPAGVGTNGTFNAGYSIGTHSSYNAGLSLNHRSGKINVFGSYNLLDRKSQGYIDLDRTLADSAFNNHYAQLNHQVSHNLQAGLDAQLSATTSIGILTGGNFTNVNADGNGTMPIIYLPTGQVTKLLFSGSNTDRRRNSGSLNLNYRYADKSGHTLGMDADYDAFSVRSDQLQPNSYYNGAGTLLLYQNNYQVSAPSTIYIYSFKTDYEQKLWKGKLAAGAKVSYTTTSNDYRQYDQGIFDPGQSDLFNYNEQINAAYLNYNRTAGKWAVQAGLRAENTLAKGLSYPYNASPDSGFRHNYTGLFPSAALTLQADKNNQWTLSFSRRLDRPSYSLLNPFINRINDYTFRVGNTQLNPQYTNSISLTYLYRQKLTIGLNYSQVSGVFATVSDTVSHSKLEIVNRNLASQKIAALTVSYSVEMAWYSAQVNLNSYYTRYYANRGPGQLINLSTYSVEAFLQQDFDLGKGYRAELTSIYNSPAILQGSYRSKAYGDVDAGIQHPVFGKQGMLKLSVSDIFHTMKNIAVTDLAGQHIQLMTYGETRLLRMAFTYRFGSNVVKPAKRHQSGAQEENQRTN